MTPITPHHAAACAAIHQSAFPEAPWDETAFHQLLANPATYGYIHSRGGLILARTAADEAEILTLAVTPAARRQGIATALIQSACTRAQTRGATTIFLEVAATNTAAQTLYKTQSFTQTAHRRRYYPDGTDALVLRKELGR